MKQHKGASLLEYSMIAGLISVASIAAVAGVGKETNETFCRASEAIKYYTTGETPDCVTDLGLTPRFGDLYGFGGESGEDEDEYAGLPNTRLNGEGVDETAELASDEIGEQSFGIAIPEGGFPGDGPFNVVVTVTEGTGTAAACTGLEGTLDNCGNFDTVSTTQIQPEDTHFGYTLNVPDDPTEAYNLGVNVQVIDAATGNVVYDSDGGVEKKAADVYINLPNSLGHYNIPIGTTGVYYVWAPIFDFNSPFLYFLHNDTTLPGNSEVCLQGFDDSIECNNNLIMRPELHKAIGFSINTLPGKTTSAANYEAHMIFRSQVDTDQSYNLGATASREAEPLITTFGNTVFEDIVIPEGQTHYTYTTDFLGNKNDWADYQVVNENSAVKVCYNYSEGEQISCVNDGVQMNNTFNPDTIGWAVTGLSSNKRVSYSNTFALKLRSRIDNTISETTRVITVTRAEPDFSDVTAQSCHDYYLAGERADGIYDIQLGGSVPAALFCKFVDDGTSMAGGWTAVTTSSTYNGLKMNNPVANTFTANNYLARGFSLAGTDIPPHSSIAIGQINSKYGGTFSLFGAMDGVWNPGGNVSLSGTDYVSGTSMTIVKNGNAFSSATENKTLLSFNQDKGNAKRRITAINGSSRTLKTDSNLSVGVFVR